MNSVSLEKMYKVYGIDTNKKCTKDIILDFYNRNKPVLTLSWEDLENELATKWTHNKFVELLEIIYSLGIQDYQLEITNRFDSKTPDEILEIENIIFRKNNSEELYNKFIIPKAIVEKDIDYGYNEEEKKYIANLTTPKEELNKKIQFLDSHYNFDKDASLEKTRRMRKKWLEIMFTCFLKVDFFRDDKNFKKMMFENSDIQLKKERQCNIDKEIGSLHNVLYGFISWKNIYKVPYIWLNENSHFMFLHLVFDVMMFLKTILLKNNLINQNNDCALFVK